MIPAAPQLSAKSWVLMDAATGTVIDSQNADMRLPPASLTKLMTVYVATNEIQAGRLKVDDPVTVSENAWRTGGSRMFLDPGAVVNRPGFCRHLASSLRNAFQTLPVTADC
ncbi:D-alanyl-D-alanine carboxypeptidase [Pseudomonas grimontii]|nr:D-alanyl-D-alanine carboxypeptidase [Pseudomonas sp. B14(2022)]